VASSIWPHGRWRLDLDGEANHAGTTRLEDRRDPMLALATLVLAAREAAAIQGCVATVGKVRVEPNGVNAIPSRVVAWLDARGSDEGAVREVVEAVGRQSGSTATEESWTPETVFNASQAKQISGWLDDAPMLATGAGHDAGILAAAGVSTAMLFVRNPTGISHSPVEFAEREDCHLGVKALTLVTEELAR
jgi:N-carbamoyl-L-amino-acid hydrolase